MLKLNLGDSLFSLFSDIMITIHICWFEQKLTSKGAQECFWEYVGKSQLYKRTNQWRDALARQTDGEEHGLTNARSSFASLLHLCSATSESSVWLLATRSLVHSCL